ncbi:MAG: hypothetical protein C0597_04645 [Marinilabiliales bacterium]|nr:MAG: hypothetical protein C0597_04645 [Marinilabiliales bacterium]
MRNLSFIILIIIIHINTFNCICQTIQEGNHLIQNYDHKNYDTPENQTWAIVQDQPGVMFFGNNSGVLEYDGNYWHLIQLTNKSTVRSLALDTITNIIYVGGVGEFGYLEPDSAGVLTYVSLVDKLPKTYQNFEDVWQVTVLQDRVIFRTNFELFILKQNKFKVIVSDNRFHRSFYVNNTFYIREWGKGLFYLKGDKLEFIGQSGIFENERIYVMLPYEHKKILIATRTKGIYI